MSRSESITTLGEDYVSAKSSLRSHDEYCTPLAPEPSTEESSSSASASRRRTWTATTSTKRRKCHGSTEVEIQHPFGTADSSTSGRIPTILENGPPSDILFQCPEEKTLYYSTVWYKLLAQTDFLVCSRCYLKHIKGTSLAHSFVRFKPPAGAPSRCRFWVPRVVSFLWPQALKYQSVRGIIQYAKRRDATPDCPNDGSELEPPENNRRWLCYIDEEMGRLDCCEACYEDRVADTAFANRFEAIPELSEDNESTKCILSIPNIQYSIESCAKCEDWTSFLLAARQRLRAYECKGEMVPTSSTWSIQLGTGPLLICEACFLDKVAMTTFRGYFTQTGDQTPNASGKFRCSLAVGSVMVAFEVARARDDFNVFSNAIQAITDSKFCSREGIRGGPWYTLQGGCKGFQICQACYCGIIAPCEMGPFFDLADAETNSDSVVRLCDLNPAAPRFSSFVEKLAQVIDVGDFSIFSKFVRQILVKSPCPRGSASNNTRLWCCAEGCTVCPECFKTVVADTAFAHRFAMQCVNQAPGAVICSLSSPRMRREWAEACREGSIEEFLSIARIRQDVYKRARLGIQRLQRLHGGRVGLALADVLLDSRVTAEDVRMLTTGKEEQKLIEDIKDVWNAFN